MDVLGSDIDRYKFPLLSTFTALALMYILFFHGLLRQERVYTHLFYLPTVLACSWYPRKGLIVPAFLGGSLLLTHPTPFSADFSNDVLRAFMFLAVGGSVSAISERILKEKSAVGRNMDLYRSIYESAPDMYISIAPDGTITSINRSGAEQLGYNKNDLIGCPVWTVVYNDDLEQVKSQVEKIFRDKIVHSELVFRKIRLDGSVIYVRERTQLIYEDGCPFELLLDCRDITEAREYERKLLESEEVYSAVVDQTTDGIFIVQEEKLVYSNRSFGEIFGYDSEDLKGVPAVRFVAPEFYEAMKQEFEKRIRGEAKDIFEGKGLRKDGGLIDLEISLAIISYYGKPAIVGIVRDVTARNEMEQQLFKTQRLESIATLAGGIAHDFNNLLTGIMGNLSLARTVSNLPGKADDFLSKAEKASEQAKHLTSQMFILARGGAVTKKATRINHIIKEAAEFAVRGSNVILNVDLPEELWPAEVNEGQINQVISNLVINAREAMSSGGVINLRARNILADSSSHPLFRAGKYVAVSVEDHGPGIPQSLLTRIFDPYFSTKKSGRGLGLAVTNSIVKAHHGYINVKSISGAGTIFTVYLPAAV